MTDFDIPAFDRDHLALTCGDDIDFQREVIADFLSHLDSRLEEIATAVASSDPAAVRHAAHALKGASASLGAPALAEASARLESLGRERELDGATTALQRVRYEATRLREALAGSPRDQAA